MLSFLITFVAFFLFSIPSELYIKKLKLKILNVENVDDANKIRAKAKVTKISNAIVFCVVYVLFFCLIKPEGVDFSDFFLDPKFGSGSVGLLGGIIYTLKEEFKMEGVFDKNISCRTIHDVPNNSVLYLRGFANDIYTTKQSLDLQSLGESFSEYNLVNTIDALPVIAVGMTKEIESPIGATRIYLNDKDWKEGVRYMMEKASAIVVLMDYRESCIWEIEQCESFWDKTLLIVDNVEKYNRIQQEVKLNEKFPDLELTEHNVACLRKSEDGFIVDYADISHKKGYKEIGNMIAQITIQH